MRVLRMVLVVIFLGVLGAAAGGCMAISAEDNCSCLRDRDKLAKQVAHEVVVELEKRHGECGEGQRP